MTRLQIAQKDKLDGVIDINLEFEIVFFFQTIKEAKNLICGISVFNREDLCLFNSCDWKQKTLAPGHYCKRVIIPAQTLAEGYHSILAQLVFYDPDRKSVILPDILRFDAVESDHSEAVRGFYKGGWPGVMRLGLNWSDAIPV